MSQELCCRLRLFYGKTEKMSHGMMKILSSQDFCCAASVSLSLGVTLRCDLFIYITTDVELEHIYTYIYCIRRTNLK